MSREKMIAIHMKHSSMNEQEAIRVVDDTIKRQYGSIQKYNKAKQQHVKTKRKEDNYKKQVTKLTRVYDKVKNEIDSKSRNQYRMLFRTNLVKYKNAAYAELEARRELAIWQEKNGIEKQEKDVDTIMSQIAVDYPDLDLTTSDSYDDIVAMLEEGSTIEEALNTNREMNELKNDIELKKYKSMSDDEKVWYANLDDTDKKYVDQMKYLQPDNGWTAERVFKEGHTTEEVAEVKQGLKGIDYGVDELRTLIQQDLKDIHNNRYKENEVDDDEWSQDTERVQTGYDEEYAIEEEEETENTLGDEYYDDE